MVTTLGAVLSGTVLATVAPAVADSTDLLANPPQTVRGNSLPTPQINGVVWDQTVVGNTVYVAGSFTTARPYGSAAGVNTVPRTNLLAYNLTTGDLLTTWAPTTNGEVRSIKGSADGTGIYIGGTFTTVNGSTRYRVAELDATTGALDAWAPAANAAVKAIAVAPNAVYIGGTFTTIGTTARAKAAAVDPTTGKLLAFAPNVSGGDVLGMTVKSDGSKVAVVGNFSTVNGSSHPGVGMALFNTSDLAVADNTAASLIAIPLNDKIRNGSSYGAIYSVSSDADGVYGTGYNYTGGAGFEGTFMLKWDGTTQWEANCHGDTYDVWPMGNVVYDASHRHYCANLGTGGQPETSTRTYRRADALTKVATGVDTGEYLVKGSYISLPGLPTPTQLEWFPNFNTGTYTGMSQGPWTVEGSSDGKYLVMGGEFTTLNNVAQQGLARFAVSSVAKGTLGPTAGVGLNLTLAKAAQGQIQATVTSTWDRDDSALTYTVYRNDTSTVACSVVIATRIYDYNKSGSCLDSTAPPGTVANYKVKVTDPDGNGVWASNWVSIKVPAKPIVDAYSNQVVADGATKYYRLDDTDSTVADDAGSDDTTAGSGVTRGTTGALAADTSDTASTFNGSSSGLVASTQSVYSPNPFSEEVWFKTTTSGVISGLGSSTSGGSGDYDRQLYVTKDGKLNFGVHYKGKNVITSSTAVNDGKWHYAVGTFGSGGMNLYLDGVSVASNTGITKVDGYSGYWRLGGDNTWSSGMNQWFTGAIDEFAVYPTALTPAQVALHYKVANTPPAANVPPTSSFSATESNLTASFDGTASTDSDGTVKSYAWDFGDGTTATGATTTHTYSVAGTYTVTLTVTDNTGAQGTSTQQVTVTAPPAPATGTTIAADQFDRVVAGGWGTADTGGAWTGVGGSKLSTNDGYGALRFTAASQLLQANLLPSSAADSIVVSSDTNTTVTASLDSAATGSGTYVGINGRAVDANNGYRARLHYLSTGAVELQITRVVAGADTVLVRQTLSIGTHTAGDAWHIRFVATGTAPTTLQAKAWPDGTTEPTDWQLTTTDTTAALQVAAGVGLYGYTTSSTTNVPQTVKFTSFSSVAGG